MPRVPLMLAVVVLAVVGVPPSVLAQDSGRPAVPAVTMDVPGTTRSGSAPKLTMDRRFGTVLFGAARKRTAALMPAALLTKAGMHRRPGVDPAFGAAGPIAVAGLSGLTAAPAALFAAVIEDAVSPYRTAIGASALANNTGTGLGNTAAGHYTLYSNTTGGLNTGVGAWSLYSSTTGNYNTAAGYTSLWSNTTGSYNTAFGNMALYQNVTGQANTAVGSESLITATNGMSNTAVGVSSLRSASGSYNTGLGAFAGYYATSGVYNVFLGASVRGTATDTNTIRIGVPYDGAIGQNKAFIAGIRDTAVAGGRLVMIDAYGQLGTGGDASLLNGDGWYTHFNYANTSVNYMRGTTYFDSAPVYFTGGNIGIGTTTPVARLEVAGGETRVWNGNGTATHFNYANASINLVRGTTYFDSAPVYFTGGRVGIGTTTPVARLEVSGGETRLWNGNGAATHFNYAGASVNYVRGTTYFDNAPVYFTGGYIGIGTTAPSYPLQMGSGAHVTAGGVWTDASSRALKEAIRPLTLTDADTALAALQPVRYVYKADPTDAHVGFIAEDVPELVATPDRKSLAPMDIIAVLTKVVQDQQARLNAQEARLAELERLLQERR